MMSRLSEEDLVAGGLMSVGAFCKLADCSRSFAYKLMDAIDDQTIALTVRHGGMDRGFPNMPAFPQVTDEELVAVVAYVRSLSRPDVGRIDVGALE